MSRNVRKTVVANLTDKDQQMMKSWLPDGLTSPMLFETAEPIEVPVTIGKDEYVLREADEGAASAYKNAHLRAIQYSQTEDNKIKITGNTGTAETRALLVSCCLFRVCKDDASEIEQVPLEEINGWKPDIVRRLFDRVMLISHLKDEDDTEETIVRQIAELEAKLQRLRKGEDHSKNSHSGTTPTSD